MHWIWIVVLYGLAVYHAIEIDANRVKVNDLKARVEKLEAKQ